MESRPNISAAEYELALRVLIRNHQQVYLPLEKRKTLKQLKLMEDEYAEEAAVLRTRRQTEEALKTSHQLTERFWTVWNREYLTSLREAHKLQISSKRGNPRLPSVGKVVLIADAGIPRSTWKMGKISQVHLKNGAIREVELRLPNGRTIRRPVNILVPLELGDGTDSEDDLAEDVVDDQPATHRYNLRPRTSRTSHH
ncbi:unnamed protein product [Heligmosomoides polygyrus]|uniref:DUF5641 domain-containing protein n=1 Tax=Heligmosomoides polygyrus TaxID=6339 RepID=A0A183FPF5_HELPZ|nr:unnamed protein product [Heligmosomoides polygyrus]